MGQVSVELDERMVTRGLKVTGYKKIDRLVKAALEEFIHRKNRQRLLKLKGRIHWEGNLDKLRRSRV